MIIVFVFFGLAIKCILGAVTQACSAGPAPSEVVIIAAGFEMIFEYIGIKVFLNRFKK
jgi:hypothetical protein